MTHLEQRETGLALLQAAPVQLAPKPERRIRLNLPSSHVPLFHAWRP